MTIPFADGWSLLDPLFLGVVPLVWLALLWRWRRARAALPTASADFFAGLPRSLRTRAVKLPAILRALAITAFAVALARPVSREVLPFREQGVDILLVVDQSSSMNEQDMEQTGRVRRIEAARDKALEFARGRHHDRVGLLTFALFPELECPLTLDMSALAAFLRGVETVTPQGPEDRTAIGVALAQAVHLLEKSTAKSKVVVMLSDGQNNIPDIMPAEAAKLAKDAGIRVHTIGLGREIRMVDFFGNRLGGSELEFPDLETIAETTGGRFFRAKSEEALAEVYAEIDRMEKVQLEDPRYRTSDGFAWPLAVGIAVLALALLCEVLWIRSAP